jgi:hypothetical protein
VEQRSTQRTMRASAPHTQVNIPDISDEEYDDVWPPRLPTSTRRYRSDTTAHTGSFSADVQTASQGEHSPTRTAGKSVVPPRRTAATAAQASSDLKSVDPDTEAVFNSRHRDSLVGRDEDSRHLHWLGYIGLGLIGMLLVMLLGWIVLGFFNSWWTVWQDDLHYGRPRTFQIDRAVGHDDSASSPSHFIALNLNRHVEVIEFPGGDPTKAKVYMGPFLVGSGQDLSPVTLTFKDVNGDGKLDLIVNVQESHFVLINDNGQFRPPHQGENINT